MSARPAKGVPLWLWMGLRLSVLAVTTVILLALAMRVYVQEQDWMSDLNLPFHIRDRVSKLAENPHQNADELWEIFRKYSNIENFLPEVTDKNWWMLAKMIGVSIPLTVIAALLASRKIASQFTSLSKAVGQVSDGNFSVHLSSPSSAPRELLELTANFNEMSRKLAQYERELSESSAVLAHELRTPLNAAMGRLQAMLDDVFPLTPEQLVKVHGQLEQINRLVGDIHLVSLARAGQLGLQFDVVSLKELVTERVEWVALRLEFAKIRVSLEIASQITLICDSDRIGQCISILIENVLRYATEGKVLEIAAKMDGKHVLVFVRDHGPGVDSQQLARLGDRFWRAEASRSRGMGGSGLGLSIASAICQSHGGILSCENRSNGGLEVMLRLPLKPEPKKTTY